MTRSDLSQKYSHLSNTKRLYTRNQVDVTRQLIQGSSAKKDRMQYADPNDYSFNHDARFTNKKTSEFVINNTKDEKRMPMIKHSLPKVSPLNADEEDELITVVKDIITHERDLEGAKVHLT